MLQQPNLIQKLADVVRLRASCVIELVLEGGAQLTIRPATQRRRPPPPTKRLGGSPYMPSLLGPPCARAPRPSAATCGPGQPVPGSCPASPSAAAGLAVPPAITLQSLRRRHRRQFCSPQPWQLEGQQYTTTTASHTPRWPAPSAPHGPAQPPFASAIASSASNQVAPLFFSECSGSTTSEAGPTGGPACPAMPPTPHPLGSIS